MGWTTGILTPAEETGAAAGVSSWQVSGVQQEAGACAYACMPCMPCVRAGMQTCAVRSSGVPAHFLPPGTAHHFCTLHPPSGPPLHGCRLPVRLPLHHALLSPLHHLLHCCLTPAIHFPSSHIPSLALSHTHTPLTSSLDPHPHPLLSFLCSLPSRAAARTDDSTSSSQLPAPPRTGSRGWATTGSRRSRSSARRRGAARWAASRACCTPGSRMT